ncbi:MAG TPA: hypothetical protein PLD58_10435 [Phycisphaerae bacterium]|nr:hypothetical protein [Phycisphaerae bacterium]
MRTPAAIWVAGLVVLAGAWGCNDHIQPPPRTVAEYQAQLKQRLNYPTQVVVAHNLQRALNRTVGGPERVKSLELVAHLAGRDPAILAQLADVLTQTDAPPGVREAALNILLKNDYPNLAGYLARVLPYLSGNDKLRQTALDWLTRHPLPDALADVVRIWAEEGGANSPNEQRYRQILRQISGKEWDQVVMDELGNPAFTASSAAYDILVRRLSEQDLRTRVLATTARSDAVQVLQALIGHFDYLPATGAELSTASVVLRAHAAEVEDAARLAAAWRRSGNYRFNIRDFHLLSCLARDPLRTEMSREQLVAHLSQALVRREHVPVRRSQQVVVTDFDRQAPQLGMADLWNLYLLDELLRKPHVQTGMGVMAERDRADRARAWGGLIFYRNGHAEPQLYEPSKALGENDLRYAPTLDVLRLARDSLCLFHAHFEKAQNLDRVGPTAQEQADLKADNLYGLLVTSVSTGSFIGHYYNPQGQVVSLGIFPYGPSPAAAK